MLNKVEGGFVNLGGSPISLLGQLAGISGDQGVLPEHPGREVPGKLGVRGMTDDDPTRTVGAPLLKVVGIGDAIVVVTGATRSPGAVRIPAFHREGGRIKCLHDNFRMGWILTNGCEREKKRAKEKNQ